MSLFPKCTFSLRVPDGVVRAGQTLRGDLVLDVPEPIPRAMHLDLFFRTVATAGYGGGKTRSVVRKDLLALPMKIDFDRDATLGAGRHAFPFSLDIPAWLPPSFRWVDASITSTIDLRLDVDWAIDPHVTLAPLVVMPPVTVQAQPIVTRSPPSWHERLVVEVTVDQGAVPEDQPITGRIAIRGGHDARFDALVVTLMSRATIAMGRRDRRDGGGLTIRIPKESLVGGESVSFAFPPNPPMPPTFRNGFIDHDVVFRVTADVPWSIDPSFELPLQLLPAGSVAVASGEVSVGAPRLRQLAAAMSTATGLPMGRLPTLVEGTVGPTWVRITDRPLEGKLGVDVDIEFHDVDLGLVFRPVGMLDAFRESPLLPRAIGERFVLRAEREDRTPSPDEAGLAVFVRTALADAERAEAIRLSDHHLGLHYVLSDDGSDAMATLAAAAVGRAKAIAAAISALPFPSGLAEAEPAWRATAAEQNAFLVPNVPALHGVAFHARVVSGESRVMTASLRADWRKGGPVVVADVDLRAAPLAKPTWDDIENRTGFAVTPAAFPVVHAASRERVTLEAAGWVSDPRTLLPALEQFFNTVLEGRGERRTDSPYR